MLWKIVQILVGFLFWLGCFGFWIGRWFVVLVRLLFQPILKNMLHRIHRIQSLFPHPKGDEVLIQIMWTKQRRIIQNPPLTLSHEILVAGWIKKMYQLNSHYFATVHHFISFHHGCWPCHQDHHQNHLTPISHLQLQFQPGLKRDFHSNSLRIQICFGYQLKIITNLKK